MPPIVAVPLALLFVLGWSPPAGAQPAIASDRPGLGTGAFVLEAGTVQLEAGAELAIDDERRFSAGQMVVRWGLPFGELQALVNSFVVSRSPEEAARGFEDLGLGTKIPLVAREDSLHISMLASLSLPTGSGFLTTDEAVPAAALLVDRAVSEHWSVSTTLGYTAGPDAQQDALSVTPAGCDGPRAPRSGRLCGLRWVLCLRTGPPCRGSGPDVRGQLGPPARRQRGHRRRHRRLLRRRRVR